MFTPIVSSGAAPRNLLFVDDEVRVLDSIRRSLHSVDSNWHLFFANSVDEALGILQTQPMDVVITDMTMPRRDGFQLIGAIAASESLKHIPVIVLTGLADADIKRRALDAGAYDLIGKPIHREELIARIRSVLRTRDYQDSLTQLNATLEQQVIQRTADLEASRTDILHCLAMAGECRDANTGQHLIRVSQYARLLAATLGLSSEEVETIFKASPLHDIGKLGVPDQVLLKPGPLDQTERKLMQQHCEIGYRILTTHQQQGALQPINPLLVAAASIALCHHEKWDGSGYPRNLAGPAIPISARIVAVADVYDALTTQRPYKNAFAHETAVKIIHEGNATHFDPEIIKVFSCVEDEFNQIRFAWSDPAELPQFKKAA